MPSNAAPADLFRPLFRYASRTGMEDHAAPANGRLNRRSRSHQCSCSRAFASSSRRHSFRGGFQTARGQPVRRHLRFRRYPTPTPKRGPIRPPRFANVRWSPLLWLSSWLSRLPKLAGMDGNRTHPGRLSSAPQTVLKTAELASAEGRQRPPKFDLCGRHSAVVRHRPLPSAGLAVFLAVRDNRPPKSVSNSNRAVEIRP